MTTEAPAAKPPAQYPHPTWQDEGTFAVPEELREAYAAALPDPGRALGRQEAKGFHSLRLVTRREGEQLVLSSRAEMPDFQPARADDRIRVRVEVSPEEWLHIRRTEIAEEARRKHEESQRRRDREPLSRSVCAACGASEPAGMGAHASIRPRTGAPRRLGIEGMLCSPCADVAPLVLAEQTLPDGRSRLEAVRALAGQPSEPSRAEADQARVREMSIRS
jgi:hypothetical protein